MRVFLNSDTENKAISRPAVRVKAKSVRNQAVVVPAVIIYGDLDTRLEINFVKMTVMNLYVKYSSIHIVSRSINVLDTLCFFVNVLHHSSNTYIIARSDYI